MTSTRIVGQSLMVAGLAMLAANLNPDAAIAQQVNSSAMVSAHNVLRQEVGSPDLQWSPQLANVAQDWADTLVRRGSLSHSPNRSYGENIYWTSGSASESTVVNTWGSEKQNFRYGTFPDVSTTGNWADVGHYTQVIWKDTTKVGCGVAGDGQFEIWVCNYDPPGNFQGRLPY